MITPDQLPAAPVTVTRPLVLTDTFPVESFDDQYIVLLVTLEGRTVAVSWRLPEPVGYQTPDATVPLERVPALIVIP